MNLNPHIFRAYDIRGIAETDLNNEAAELIGKGFATYMQRKTQKDNLNILVGRDGRISGNRVTNAFIKGILSTGCNVHFSGVITSPLLYFGVCKFEYEAGAMITASHNPKEYNGMKFVEQGAHSVCGDELQEIYKLIISGDFNTGSGTLSEKDIWPAYSENALSTHVLSRPLKVVVDAGNGAAGRYAPELLRKFGCEVIELYCDIDGEFPNHEANPEEIENMQELITTVKKEKADLGIGFDGDGDRVGVIDEKGQHYASDLLLLILARDLLTRMPKSKIVFDVKVSQVLINDIKAHGGEPVMCKTGHSFIENKMKEIGAPLAGEVSGHLFFAENYYGFDDAFIATLRTLQIIANANKPFSELFADVPETLATPEFKIPCPDEEKFKILENISDYFAQNYPSSRLDGVRSNFDQDSWCAIRCSNTSPNLTLRFETKEKTKLEEMQKIMKEQLSKHSSINTKNLPF